MMMLAAILRIDSNYPLCGEVLPHAWWVAASHRNKLLELYRLGKAWSITEKLLILLGRPFLDPFTREAGFGLGSLSAPVVVSGPASSAPRLQ